MLAAIGPISASLGLVSNAKKAVDAFKDLASDSLPDEGFILWRLLDSTAPALELCTKLASRHETLPYVESAVAITRRTILRCEQLLQRGEEEDDERPESAASWASWFEHKKGGVARSKLVPQLCQNLQMCQQALQLALTAIQVEYGPGSANPPFKLLPAAVDRARSLIESFEMGRCSRQLLFSCALYELAGSATRKAGADWSSRGIGQCFLKLEQDKLCLELTRLEPDEDAGEGGVDELAAGVDGLRLLPGGGGSVAGGSGGRPHQKLVLDDEIVFERSSLGAIIGAEMCSTTREAASLAYKLSGSICQTAAGTPRGGRAMATAAQFIPAGEGISAETIEALVQLCAMKKGSLDSPQLSAVFDCSTVAAMEDLSEQLQLRTGAYAGDDGPPATPLAATTPRPKRR